MAILDDTLGPFLIGFTISTFLFGVTTVQVYLYYHYFPKDRTTLKLLVAFVWIMEFAFGILTTAGAYRELVTLFGDPEVLITMPVPINVSLILGGILALMSQGFFVLRVWKMTESKLATAILTFLSTLRFVGTTALGILTLTLETPAHKTLEAFMDQFDWLVTTNLVIGACVDVLITLCLTTKLSTQRRLALKSTVHLLDKLILWTIETGLLTSITAVTTAICFLTMKTNFVWMGFYLILPRVFANCLLAALNSRHFLHELRSGNSNTVISLGTSQFSEVSRGDLNANVGNVIKHPSPRQLGHKNIAIEMTTVIEAESTPFDKAASRRALVDL